MTHVPTTLTDAEGLKSFIDAGFTGLLIIELE